MKTVLAVVLLSGVTAFAGIQGSDLVPRHQTLIEDEISKQCGFSGVLVQLANIATNDQVDNGIVDVNHKTTVQVKVGVDQYETQNYLAVVKSKYHDNYDHNAQDWGSYSVSEVQCRPMLETPTCLGEAQIIAKTLTVSRGANNKCVAQVDAAKIQEYNVSGACPLNLKDVINTGVTVGEMADGQCYSGDVNGTLVKKADGSIELE